jgi:glycine oxidase
LIIVIGAGVVGLSVAWRLAEDGAHVTLLDPQPGFGATHAAAGMLAPASEYWFQEDPLLDFARYAAQAYPEVCARLSALTGVDLQYRQEGTLVAAATRADRETLHRLQDAQVRHGLSVASLSTREARRLEPALAPRLAGAFLSGADHALDPRALTEAYLQALNAHPHVTLHRNRAVTLTSRNGRVSGVRDASGTEYVGDSVVLANGLAAAELDGLPEQWDPQLRPVYGETIRLQAPVTSAGSAALFGPRHVVRALVEDRSVYVVPRGDGRYVLGATEREDHQTASPAGAVYRLLRDAHQVVPDVLEMRITEIVARARPATRDHLPLLGTLGPGLIVASGTYRHGVLLATAVAETVSQLVQQQPPPVPIEAFDPWRNGSRNPTPTSDHHTSIGKENPHGEAQRRIIVDYS